MSRFAIVICFVVLLGGCGSCLDGNQGSEGTDAPPTIKTVTKTTEQGKRPVVVSDGFRFADHAKRDGGPSEQR